MASAQISPTESLTGMGAGRKKMTEVPGANTLSDPRAPREDVIQPCPEQLISASRVFDVVELLEQVLIPLESTELVRSRRICKLWKVVIEESKALRRNCPLEPIKGSDVKLLEQVLAHLDLTDLVRARRVCKSWDLVVQHSKALRQNRYLEPVERSEWVLRVPRVRSDIRMVKQAPAQDTEAWVPATLHPAIRKAVQNWFSPRFPFTSYYCSGPTKDLSYSLYIESRHFASWVSTNKLEQALLCQPPCKRLRFFDFQSKPRSKEIHSETGVTFQDLLDLVCNCATATAGSNTPYNDHVSAVLVDVTIATDRWTNARVDTARRKCEKRKLVVDKKLAAKANRKALNKTSVFDQPESFDLPAFFDETSLGD